MMMGVLVAVGSVDSFGELWGGTVDGIWEDFCCVLSGSE